MSAELPPDLLVQLRDARNVAVLTGAGTSAESGVPTFRDALSGLWSSFRPEDLATPEAFERNPKLVWDWYAGRRAQVSQVLPNAGHQALARLARRYDCFTVITQNVDGLHQLAGSQDVIELHGNIRRVKCHERGHPVDRWEESGEGPPRCPHCQGRLRPDVVWFGEALPETSLARAIEVTLQCDVFLSVGTSALVYPAAGLPLAALEAGKPVVEINPEHTPLSGRATWFLAGKSGVILPALEAALG
jgi:NAD-dependent deacetylase